jgi:hypothetical protein
MAQKYSAEYEVVVKVRLFSTLGKQALERQLVVALWEGMDESIVIPDGATDGLQVIEYVETVAREA